MYASYSKQQHMNPTDIAMEPKETLHHSVSPIQPKLVVNHVLKTISNLKIGPPSRSLKSVSLWLLKNVFWFVIYLLSSYLTINSCLLLLEEYSRTPILTHVKANTTRMVPLPNITVCVPFNATAMFPLNSSSATPYSNAIEDFFSKTIETGKCNTANYIKEWKRHNSPKNISNGALFILYEYLAIMHEAEYLRETMENPFDSSLGQAESDQKYALLNITVPRIKQLNITIDELKNVFIEYFKIGSTKEWGSKADGVLFCILPGTDDYIDQCDFFDSISFLDQNQICFKMPNYTLQANDPALNKIIVEINDHSETFSMAGRKIIFNFDEVATPPNFAATADESSIIEMTTSESKELYFDYESVYRALPRMSNGTLSCSYQSRRECEEKCRTDLIKELCGCTPVTFTIEQSDENKCTFAHYEKCLTYSGNEDEECRKNCPVSCEQTNYKLSKPVTHDMNTLLYSLLRITLNKYDYFIYEEEFKWTFADLISAIGGALGIWLGIDFIVLIRFMYTLVTKVSLKVLPLLYLKAATSEDEIYNFNESIIKKMFTALNIEVPPRFTRVSRIMWLIGKGLWAIIYLAGGVFTAIFCFQLYEQYASGELKTSMQISFNKSISLPPATLCLRQDIYYYNINPSFAPSSNYTDALNDYLNQENISKESILHYGDNGSSWSPVMVYVVYKYLNVLYYYDYVYDFSLNDGTLQKNKFPINEWQKYLTFDISQHIGWADEYCCISPRNFNFSDVCLPSVMWWERMQIASYLKCQEEIRAAHDLDCANAIENILIPKLTELSITVEELRQKTLYQLNSDAQLTFRFYGLNSNTAINNLRPAAFNHQAYCMYIPLDNFEYSSEKDYAEIAIKSKKTLFDYWDYSIILTFDARYSSLGDSTSRSMEEKRVQTKVGSVFQMPFGESKSFSLRINYKMALEPDSQKCINVKSMEEWDILNRIQCIEEMCNCSPTSWPETLPATNRMCTILDYKTCPIFNESSLFIYNRSDTSDLPCEKIKMDILESEMYDDETSMTNALISRIQIRVEDFVYLTMKEEMTMTFKQFAVAFGGTLGILLGIDFRFIAWLIFMPPFIVLSWLLEKLLYRKAFFLKPMKNTKLKTALDAKLARLITTTLELDFSDTLKLNKFAFIKKMTKNAYWLIYYSAGGVLTLLLLISVVFSYMRNDNAKVKFEPMNNDSISLPSPTICLPFVSLKIDSDHGQSNIDSTNFVQNYFSNKTKIGLLKDEWDHAFINYVHSYIVQYGKYEWFSFDDFPKTMNHSAFFDIIGNVTNVLDLTLEEMREKFGRELTRMYQLNIAYCTSPSDHTTDCLNISTQAVFVEESKICYKPPMEFLTFNSSSDFLKITANGELMRNSSDFFGNLPSLTINLNGKNTNKKEATLLDATVSGSFGKSTTVALEIDTIIKAYPVVGGKMVCSNLLSRDQCRSSCIAEAIQDTCECLPRTTTLTTSSNENVRFCTLADYKQCNSTLQSNAFACLDGCLEPCERIRFSTWSSVTESILESMNEVEIDLRMGSFKYDYMEEQLTYTTEEFIGEIGGALGLFLGLSVLMFIEFFYALFVRLFNIFVTKKWATVQPRPDLDEKTLKLRHN